jgi:surfeit locus 1 family protein
MPYFRPLPVLTLACAVMFAILLGLGYWQLQRLHWKLGLIAEVHNRLTLSPVSLDRALAMGDAAQYRRVGLSGHFENAREVYVYTTGPHGGPAYHVLTPFVTDDGRTVLVDRGIVPVSRLAPAARAQGLLAGERHIVGVWHSPDARGIFTPQPDLAQRVWYSPDVKSIAAAEHLTLATDVLVEADATPNPGGWPEGGQTVVTFRNEHMQYALTWFGMAGGLLGVYLAFHISRGRLGWRRRT